MADLDLELRGEVFFLILPAFHSFVIFFLFYLKFGGGGGGRATPLGSLP